MKCQVVSFYARFSRAHSRKIVVASNQCRSGNAAREAQRRTESKAEQSKEAKL